jgi:hypothetical protein
MTLPDLRFDIRGRDQSGAAFRSARRQMGDTRRAAMLLNADARAATASITGLGKSALIGVTGIGGLAAAIHKMKIGLADFDRIAKVARQNGLDGEFYQTLAFMAGEASVEVSTLDTALRKFTVGVGQAAEGSGSLYTELRRLNPALLEALLNAGSGEEQIRLYADAVRNASSANERAALVAAGFGQRGAELVRVLELGSSAMDDAGQKARDLGNIIEDDVLPYAEEMQNRLGNASDALDKQLKASLLVISPLMVNFYENAASAAKYTREWTGAISDVGTKLTELGNSNIFAMIRDKMADAGLLDPDAVWNWGMNDDFRQQLRKVLEERARARAAFSTGETFGDGDPWLGDITVTPRSKPSLSSGRDRWTDPASRTRASQAADRQAQAYQRVVDQLNRETAALGLNSTEQRIANELALAGVGAQTEQGRQIARMVTHIEQQRAAQEGLNEQLQFFGDLGVGVFRDLAFEGAEFGDVMRRLALSIGDAALQAAVFGQGPMAQLLGLGRSGGGFGGLLGLIGGGVGIPGLGASAFSGWYEKGGGIGAGKWGIAGEAGVPEVVTGPAHVWTMDDLAAIAGGGGGGGDVYAPVYNVDARGAQDGVAEQIVRALEEYDRRVAPETARRAVGRANRVSSSNDFRR